MRASLLLALVASLLVVLPVASAAVSYTPAALADQITDLPGLSPQATFNQFSGYLVIDEATNKSIFYCEELMIHHRRCCTAAMSLLIAAMNTSDPVNDLPTLSSISPL